jgi:hypothetical protein
MHADEVETDVDLVRRLLAAQFRTGQRFRSRRWSRTGRITTSTSGCTATCFPANLLVVDGRLSAVIDWGGLGVGDPACDLQPAWNVFTGESRAVYRAELEVDDASWLRGRGWALLQAVIALPYYWETNQGMVAQASHALGEVLADARSAS